MVLHYEIGASSATCTFVILLALDSKSPILVEILCFTRRGDHAVEECNTNEAFIFSDRGRQELDNNNKFERFSSLLVAVMHTS